MQRKVTDILLSLRGEGEPKATTPKKPRRQRAARPEMPTEELERLVQGLEEEMHQAAKDLRFEYAARLRDEVHDLKRSCSSLGKPASPERRRRAVRPGATAQPARWR